MELTRSALQKYSIKYRIKKGRVVKDTSKFAGSGTPCNYHSKWTWIGEEIETCVLRTAGSLSGNQQYPVELEGRPPRGKELLFIPCSGEINFSIRSDA